MYRTRHQRPFRRGSRGLPPQTVFHRFVSTWGYLRVYEGLTFILEKILWSFCTLMFFVEGAWGYTLSRCYILLKELLESVLEGILEVDVLFFRWRNFVFCMFLVDTWEVCAYVTVVAPKSSGLPTPANVTHALWPMTDLVDGGRPMPGVFFCPACFAEEHGRPVVEFDGTVRFNVDGIQNFLVFTCPKAPPPGHFSNP